MSRLNAVYLELTNSTHLGYDLFLTGRKGFMQKTKRFKVDRSNEPNKLKVAQFVFQMHSTS